MTNNFETTIISLIILTIFITLSLSLLALRTLKEGRKALKQIKNDRSSIAKKNVKI